MIFILFFEASTVAGTFALGFADNFAIAAVGNSIMEAAQRSESPEDMAKDARTICNRARWSRHRAAQMLEEAETLDKDATDLLKTSEAYLSNVVNTTALMRKQLATWDRLFRVQLVLVIIGTVVACGVFIKIALTRGRFLRTELDKLRAHSSSAQDLPIGG
jgi:hypothetical protein